MTYVITTVQVYIQAFIISLRVSGLANDGQLSILTWDNVFHPALVFKPGTTLLVVISCRSVLNLRHFEQQFYALHENNGIIINNYCYPGIMKLIIMGIDQLIQKDKKNHHLLRFSTQQFDYD